MTDNTFPNYIDNQKFPLLPLNAITHVFPNTFIQDIRWSLGDSPALFEKNIQSMGESWHYYHKEIIYNVNSNGYRAPEWNTIDWKNSVVILGCSMVFGTGVAEDETLSYYLEQLLHRPVINLGYPSISNEGIFNNSVSILEHFGSPLAVINVWAPVDRFLFFSTEPHHIGLWTNDKDESDGVSLGRLYEDMNLNQTNMRIKSYYLEKANQRLWKNKTQYYSASYFKSTADCMKLHKLLPSDRNARDMVHPGPDSNLSNAKYLFSVLKNRGL